MFGTLGTEFFRNLAGNTHILKTGSKITGANSPHKEAVWTLESLHALFSEYCFELYDRRIHPAFNMSRHSATNAVWKWEVYGNAVAWHSTKISSHDTADNTKGHGSHSTRIRGENQWHLLLVG
jgi:hypothetical protein